MHTALGQAGAVGGKWAVKQEIPVWAAVTRGVRCSNAIRVFIYEMARGPWEAALGAPDTAPDGHQG